jgi:multiple sugar transport system permease protein
MMLPLQSTMLSSYILLRYFDMLNRPLALILPMVFSPLAVFLFRQFIKVIPDELIDCTLLETSSALKIMRFVIVPQIRPALITLFILIFCESWNMVEQAIIFASNNIEIMPLSVRLSDLPENVYFAGSIVYIFPIIVLFLLFEGEIEKGVENYKW